MERIPEHRGGLRAAIVLAGGRGSRLGGADKAALTYDGASLLDRAVAALASPPAATSGASPPAATSGAPAAGRAVDVIAVVGPSGLRDRVDRLAAVHGVRILLTRETPAFAGPAAAVGAGIDALDGAGEWAPEDAGLCVVLAVDYARPERILAVLRRAEEGSAAGADAEPGREAWVPRDVDGWDQPLASLWDRAALRRAVGELRREGTLANASMRALLGKVGVAHLTTAEPAGADPAELFADVDTWDDAARAGITAPAAPEKKAPQEDDMEAEKTPGTGRGEHPELDAWARELTSAYGLEDAPVDIERILSLAGEAAHAIVRPAAPLTTYIAGYAAGLAAARSEAGGENAAAEADALARRAIADRAEG
ncbi:DUF6457 domain-containing protein [Zhihengliuella salsuginis]|uniref:Molybdopterin-guanine dinucleotide biosynthesis protein A n=1 Tax=Zhihengliuella salsuginis TaxID=578222 RepID=A0ABQ3GL85_9MICC|nr:DUF6457 domain-containing protein [Zhihengliuella salsuginis]GHD10527.1 hypothetical protein GCM10008096_24170 [Zhihengliuella salsuginis]